MVPTMERNRTIDIHAHMLPQETIRQLAREAARVAPKLIAQADGSTTMEIGGKVVQRPMPPECWDLDLRLADMDQHGIDMQAICATVHTFFYDVEPALGIITLDRQRAVAADHVGEQPPPGSRDHRTRRRQRGSREPRRRRARVTGDRPERREHVEQRGQSPAARRDLERAGELVERHGPHAPQRQPKSSTPTNTANALIRLARPIHHGVSRLPTRVWIANDAVPIYRPRSIDSNCTTPITVEARPITIAPRYGTRLVMPARMPQTTEWLRPSAQKAKPDSTPTTMLVAICTNR